MTDHPARDQEKGMGEKMATLRALAGKCPERIRDGVPVKMHWKEGFATRYSATVHFGRDEQPPSTGERMEAVERFVDAACDPDTICALLDLHDAAQKRIAVLEGALREIAKGEGAFSRDQLEHAINVVENAKDIARAALEPGEK